MLTRIDKLTIPNISIEKTAFLVGGETIFSQSIDKKPFRVVSPRSDRSIGIDSCVPIPLS